jgi:hypothetical protein
MAKKDPNDLLKEIADESVKAAAEGPPDFVEVEGVRYYRDPVLAAANNRVKKAWRNPRTQEVDEIEVEQIAINLAPYASEIRLDGVIYCAGRVYDFPVAVASSVREIIWRTWQHEASTGGAYSNGAVSGVRGSSQQSGILAGGGVRFG